MVLFLQSVVILYLVVELLGVSMISAVICLSREIEELGFLIFLGSFLFRLRHIKAMTQVTF